MVLYVLTEGPLSKEFSHSVTRRSTGTGYSLHAWPEFLRWDISYMSFQDSTGSYSLRASARYLIRLYVLIVQNQT